ncbi:NADH-cytochrome b-5 reductase [Xylariales sp. AK1849]|nr:NADH-cytochrome b-5 reductase [Xylariales sp. AK1849]
MISILRINTYLRYHQRIAKMASTSVKKSHLERTAAEPRDKSLRTVLLKKVDQVNDQIRLFRLEIPNGGPPIRFLPGQWLDVFAPGVPKAGGFTLTSTPSKARFSDTSPGYLELAVQKSPDNAPAAWLWQDTPTILHQELQVRVGGSFVWPPPGVNVRTLRRVVFVAGGVGINPLISMLSALAEKGDCTFEVQFLYSMKDPGDKRQATKMLFLERLTSIFGGGKVNGDLKLFLTGGTEGQGIIACDEVELPFQGRRMTISDLQAAVGEPVDRHFTVVYVCGLPAMTDDFVKELTAPNGLDMAPHTVLREKWW